MKHILPLILLAVSLTAQAQNIPTITGNLTVSPAAITLTRQHEPHSLLVMGRTADGHDVDLSLATKWTSSNEAVARVDSLGWVSAVTNGQVMLTGNAAGKSVQVSVSEAGETVRFPAMTGTLCACAVSDSASRMKWTACLTLVSARIFAAFWAV